MPCGWKPQPRKQAASLIGAFLLLLMLASCRKAEPANEFTVFAEGRGCAVSLPENPSKQEQRAARLIQHTLAKASGLRPEDFPIRSGEDDETGVIRLDGSNHRRAGEARLAEKVTWRVRAGRVEITSYPAESIEAAAAWFLEQNLGARWFMPGELGEHVPAHQALRLPPGEQAYSPSYISRNLGLAGSAEEQAWWGRNRLRVWFHHNHAMSGLFSPEDLKRNPSFVPMVNGAKFIPATANEANWQPNIAAESAAEHAATVLRQRREFSSAIGMNDSIRFDQSARTLALVGEPRWFRHKPDYSKLVFGFVNEVARRVPGRYLGAYAYDWTEDTPGFPVERNVVPFLTADRSEWFDPAFAEEDKALIRRWVAAGPEVVGLYDYYYGAPFLVPRPTLYAVGQAIPFAHQAGARAFYAEVYPNWGLDGPKAWLAAGLLWDATASPEELLNIYYRDFWQEAAGPMREFFAVCDGQWLHQPKPSYWIKYYKDEHQHLLFPVEVRQRLQGLLAAAQAATRSDLTRKRVDFFAQAFAVTDAFCAWEEAKDRLSRAALLPGLDQAELHEAWRQLTDCEARFKQVHAHTSKQAPLAVKASILGEYERNDPRRRAAWRMKDIAPSPAAAGSVPKPEIRNLKPEIPDQDAALLSSPSGFRSQVSDFSLRLSGIELLRDASLMDLKIKPPAGFTDLEWVMAGPWRGHGEPYETRRVEIQNLKPVGSELNSNAGSGSQNLASISGFRSQVSGFALVMRGCKQETLSQLTVAEPGKHYVARVKVKAKVSPGNMTFLILNFQDEAGRALGLGVVDRLPVGDYPEGVELVVWAQAPEKAKWVGLGVRALNQVETDYAAFEGFSLQAVEQAQPR